MMKLLENKNVLITGGLSGIGMACAMAAANEGAKLIIVDLPDNNFNKSMDEILQKSKGSFFLPCDVSSYNEVERTMNKAVELVGQIDVALNNAGIGGAPHKVGEMSEEEWLKVIGVNLNGVFNCMRHELSHMSAKKTGNIVNMSSILGKVGFQTSAHYVAAKHGVIGLTQSAAIEYATLGIRINAICPGFISTPLLIKSGIDNNTTIKEHLIDLHPMKRFGEASEVANGFIFLASEMSSFITGTALEIDGGYLSN